MSVHGQTGQEVVESAVDLTCEATGTTELTTSPVQAVRFFVEDSARNWRCMANVPRLCALLASRIKLSLVLQQTRCGRTPLMASRRHVNGAVVAARVQWGSHDSKS
eukprot:6387151-Amphidinium_carterae.1